MLPHFSMPQNISVESANNAGTVVIHGGDGNDRLTGSAGVDILNGNFGKDVLIGNVGNDDLRGDAGNDTLLGGAGNDNLIGGTGVDNLTGGEGSDLFYLNNYNQFGNINVNGVDTITDFVSGVDNIAISCNYLSDSSFADQLVQGAGAVALDANDRFIFDSSTGILNYDSDGSGANEAVQFAILQGVTQLSADDFFVMANLCVMPDPIGILIPIDFVPSSQGVSVVPPPDSHLNWDNVSLVGINLMPFDFV